MPIMEKYWSVNFNMCYNGHFNGGGLVVNAKGFLIY